jgi:hypothetical protein
VAWVATGERSGTKNRLPNLHPQATAQGNFKITAENAEIAE